MKLRSDSPLRQTLLAFTLIALSFGNLNAQTNQPTPKPDASKWKRTLAGTPTQPQTKVTERDWPSQEGSASVCLWHDDSLAAFSYTIDDNCAGDIPFWLGVADKYKIKLTWFVITKNISGTDRPALNGKWEDWKKVFAAGHDVQSHTVDHMDKKSDLTPDVEYGDSQKVIEKNIPGDRCLTMAYPGGGRANDTAVGIKYYISCRGTVPAINVPGKTPYENTHNTSAGIVMDTKNPQCVQACIDPKSPYYRGWYCGLSHFIGDHQDAKKMIADGFDFLTSKPGNYWIGRYRDIVLYGMERDTNKLQSRMVSSGKYEINLTCEMDPAIYDFPLTVKVRLNERVKSVSAQQAGKAVVAEVIENAGQKYALVEVVPNRGPAAVEAK